MAAALLSLMLLAGKPWQPTKAQCDALARHLYELALTDNRAEPNGDVEERQLRAVLTKAEKAERIAKLEKEIKANEKKTLESHRDGCLKKQLGDAFTAEGYACMMKAATEGQVGKCLGQ